MIRTCDRYPTPCGARCDTDINDSLFGWIKVVWNDDNGDGVATYNFHSIECMVETIRLEP